MLRASFSIIFLSSLYLYSNWWVPSLIHFIFFTSLFFSRYEPVLFTGVSFFWRYSHISHKECIHFTYLYQYSVISRKFFFWYLPEDFDTQQQLSLESLSTIKLKVKVIKWILGSRPESFNLLALSVFCIYTPSFFHYKKNTSQLR